MTIIKSSVNTQEIDAVVNKLSSMDVNNDLDSARKSLDNLGSPITDDIDVSKFKINNLSCQLISPQASDANKVILYLHGGGYFCGSLLSHGGLVSEIAKESGTCALQLEYRKAPEHKFPAPVEDSCSVYSWLLDRGYRAENIIIAGDSAGGGLTMATLLSIKNLSLPLPSCAVCLSPWVDMEATGESYKSRQKLDPIVTMKTVNQVIKMYMNGTDLRIPTASPLYGDLSGLPPLLIQVGEREILYSDAEMLAEKAESDGVDVIFEEWTDMVHVWQMFYQQLSVARDAIKRIGIFIREKSNDK